MIYMHTFKILIFISLSLVLPNLAFSKDINLLTSIKPLQLIAAAIQQDISKPDVLLPVGASAHHYALRPTDIQKIQDADLFYWIGPDMEIFLTKVVASRVKPTLAIQQLSTIHLRHFGDNKESHDAYDHEHQIGTVDPHLWLSPTNARVIAIQMTSDLVKLDPNNEKRYQQNLQSFLTNLAVTDKTIHHYFAQVKLKPFFVFHETYDYFEDAYQIKHAGVFNISSSVQPGARHVAGMREHLQQISSSCIFYEPPVKPKLADTLTNGLDVRVYMLDALGADIEVDAQGYPQLLSNLARQMLKCRY